jgi:hypothetical protein
VIIIHVEFGGGDLIPHFPEPIEEWVTLRRNIEESREKDLPCIIIENSFAEYEARHGLPPGMLSEHKLCGKVPFVELLSAATAQMQNPPQ